MNPATVSCCGQDCRAPSFLDVRGLLSFWILWELRLGPLNGAQISNALAWRRGAPVSPGTLYPALAALEKQGAAKKQKRGRETSYTLTAAGRRELDCAATYLGILFRDVVHGTPAPNAAPN